MSWHTNCSNQYGFYAVYRRWVEGLVIAIISAAIGVVFAAPGAVYIYGQNISPEENGKISIAGPLTNIGLAVIFFVLSSLLTFSPILSIICSLGFTVNSFLAFFNLLPIFILDGAKVLKWNPVIWVITTGMALIMVAYPYIIPFLT